MTSNQVPIFNNILIGSSGKRFIFELVHERLV